jgi:exonuclease SbcC
MILASGILSLTIALGLQGILLLMILNYLHLHNFMSYGDSVLDLSGVGVACLTGYNGAGKSALLDAFTWALWEEARSASDDLIRLGQKEMWVDVIFSHEARLYRVRRSRLKLDNRHGKRMQSRGSLDFMVADATASGITGYDGLSWTTLTAGSMKETGKQIQELLRMDFDTFINSAYLKQGRAEEFATRPPSERKQVLCEILGLSYFDRLQEEAREELKRTRSKIDFIEIALKTQAETTEKLEQIEAEYLLAKQNHEKSLADLAASEHSAEECRLRLAEGKIKQLKFEANVNRLDAIEAGLARSIAKSDSLSRQHSLLLSTLADGDMVGTQLTRFELVRTLMEEADGRALKSQELTEQRLNLVSLLGRERSRLELACEQVQRIAGELSKEKLRLDREVEDEEKIRSNFAEYKQLLISEAELAGKQEAYALISERITMLNNSLSESRIYLEAEILQKDRAFAEYTDLSASAAGLALEGEELTARRAELDGLESEFDLIEKQGLALKADIEAIKSKVLDGQSRKLQNLERVHELELHSHCSLCPLCAAPIVDRAAVIARYQAQNLDIDRDVGALEALICEKERSLTTLRKRFVYTRKALEKRPELDKQIGRFNEREAALARASAGFATLGTEREALAARLAQNNFAQVERESLISLNAELTKIGFDPAVYSSLQSQIRLKRYVESRHQQLLRDLEERARVNAKLPEALREKESLAQELEGENYGHELRAGLAAINNAIEDLGYDRAAHNNLKDELKNLFGASGKMRDLRQALAERPRIEAELEVVSEETRAFLLERSNLEREQNSLQKDLADFNFVQENIKHLTPGLVVLREANQAAFAQVVVLAERRDQLEHEQKIYRERLDEHALLQNDLDELTNLAEAFGKKGIQAVIIENAIPEIEAEANRILARLTEGKMHVALITQAKTRAGGLSETLELVMGDEVGTRSYELYSGGEAFKVNFALRIALARLLARRAGARLETLIIDEGFGSQDDRSRDKLVKAIGVIQPDFSRVLVITHISDVKDMFPVQIQVAKKNGISSFKLVS